MTRPLQPRRNPYAPRRVLPPILRPLGARVFSGFEIIREYDGAAGVVLWCGFRDATLWATTKDHTELFADRPSHWGELIGELDPLFSPIAPQLHLLAHLADQEDAAAVALDCDAIAEWSEQQSKLGTAVEFAQAASAVNPDRAMYAARAARLLKERAEWGRSATWYDYAIFTARRLEDWYAYADAYCGLAGLHAERGNLPRARKLLTRALRIALRYHINEQAANAYHYLFTLEAVAGNWDQAEEFVVKALTKYPVTSPKRARLARDLAYRWINRGYFERALPLAQEVLKHFSSPALRALVWSDIARAAAGSGDGEVFETAWAQAKVLLDQGVSDPYSITILLNLAHGAAFRGEAARATLPARKALELAKARGEPQSVFESEALLDSLQGAGFKASERPPRERDSNLVDEVLRQLRRNRAVV